MVKGKQLDPVEIGKRIEQLISKKGYSRKQVAGALNVTESALSQWIIGKKRPSISNFVLLSELLECGLDYLLYGVEE